MTLILALGNNENVVQVSDRRLTVNKVLIEDESNKAGIFISSNARLAFGFSGIASYGDFKTNKWLMRALYDSCPPNYDAQNTLLKLKEKATNTFRTNRWLRELSTKDKQLSVVFSGFLYHHDPPVQAFAILTNSPAINPNVTNDDFAVDFYFPNDANAVFARAIGAWTAITREDVLSLQEFMSNAKPLDAIMGKAVNFVREIADRPQATNTVGKQLSIISVPRNITEEVHTGYQSATIKYDSFYPSIVIGTSNDNRSIIDDIEVTGPPIIPIVPKRHLCPCGSGKRYKNCCGKKR